MDNALGHHPVLLSSFKKENYNNFFLWIFFLCSSVFVFLLREGEYSSFVWPRFDFYLKLVSVFSSSWCFGVEFLFFFLLVKQICTCGFDFEWVGDYPVSSAGFCFLPWRRSPSYLLYLPFSSSCLKALKEKFLHVCV